MASLHMRRFASAFLVASFVLLGTLDARVVRADDGGSSESGAMGRDTELAPWGRESRKPRYAGWLLAAYLVPPVVAIGGVVANSEITLISSAALVWLAPTAVHLIAGEYGLAARELLMLVFAAGGTVVGGLVGFGVGSAIGQDQYSREEDPGLHRVVGLLLGGVLGGTLGVVTWGIIDLADAFRRDHHRRVYGAGRAPQLALSIQPRANGLSAMLLGSF